MTIISNYRFYKKYLNVNHDYGIPKMCILSIQNILKNNKILQKKLMLFVFVKNIKGQYEHVHQSCDILNRCIYKMVCHMCVYCQHAV